MKLYRFTAVLCLLFILCSCKHGTAQNKEDTAPPANEDVSVQESALESSESEESAADKVFPDVEIVDFIGEWVSEGGPKGVIYAVSDESSQFNNEELFVDIAPLVDNETDLSELLNNTYVLTPFETYLVMQFDSYPYYPDRMGYLEHITMKATSAYFGKDITFVRTTNDFENSDENWPGNGKRCYTVFKSELGGYVYFFFDWYPESTGLNTKLRQVLYCSDLYKCSDLRHIKDGGYSMTQFMELYPEFKSFKKTEVNKNTGIYIRILLKDGIFTGTAIQRGEGMEFYATRLLEGSIIFPYEENEANSLNVTILPQDYPPAS